MGIKGFIKTSLVDWDGKVTSVIFLPNCNFRCPMCHNYGLILHPERYPDQDYEEIMNYLSENSDFLDGVVITGGEPTLHEGLERICKDVRNLGLKVKLDTNGYMPDKLLKLLEDDLVDYIAMDVKAPLREDIYSKLSGVKVDIERIKESIGIIKSSGIDYEFRTTVVPSLLKPEDVVEISKELSPARRFAIQQFVPENSMSKVLREIKPYDKKILEELARECKRYINEVILRA
ncbi:MAG: anaerobic ribonucleoside-triphosphate reductase activating protein [Thermoplasmata archaeon]|nr:MAG: anaerobic ribonucleoside-triphosphate reductase activating protein [Thermoplasmata archaeon]HDO69701.1 anaerobic ribonucleoside-triphosphate reductase activating protein [Thermoplasmatales archaeon]HEX17616.1 anaerobic ribonucleoside-triphosphate reductase activating protein [Thermoplasmatales archaeon]